MKKFLNINNIDYQFFFNKISHNQSQKQFNKNFINILR